MMRDVRNVKNNMIYFLKMTFKVSKFINRTICCAKEYRTSTSSD